MQDDEETPRAAELPQRARRSESLGDLALRMTQAMADLKNPEPKEYNAFHKYNFVSVGQITELVRKQMAKHGIAMLARTDGDSACGRQLTPRTGAHLRRGHTPAFVVSWRLRSPHAV